MKQTYVGLTAVLVLALMACGPSRPTPDAGKGGGAGGGATGGSATGGGTGGGATGGGATGGGATGGGTGGGGGAVSTTIAGAKNLVFPAHIQLTGVVVTAVSSNNQSNSATCGGGWYADFWVADSSHPQDGLFVSKFCTDLPLDFQPQLGDKLDIDGYIGFAKNYNDRDGYRVVVKEQYDFLPPAQRPGDKLIITKTGSMAPLADNQVSPGFGDAQGGAVKANKEYGSARVHIPGPLSITNASPPAFQRISAKPGDNVYFGFEVSGGVLVNNYKTYRSFGDGGVPGCDWRAVVLDGGTVSFPSGISGVWDTYTHAPCGDGGVSSSCRTNKGYVPGTPDANFTYVLYPQDCTNDLVGQ